jgi:hypothetical protein
VVERLRVAGLRPAVVVPAALRVPVEPVPVDRVAAAPVDFARDAVGFFAAVERLPVEREDVDFLPDEPVERFVELVARTAVPPLLELSSSLHLPDRTRCAASATASAISDPSLDALETIVLAAACAVSAASRPASRILRRAAGLALIAAAAAAKPAASISRLIAALAILSSVSLLEPLLFVDFAIANLPLGVSQKDTSTAERFRFSNEPRL